MKTPEQFLKVNIKRTFINVDDEDCWLINIVPDFKIWFLDCDIQNDIVKNNPPEIFWKTIYERLLNA